MVGFISETTIEDLDQAPKLKTLSDPLDPIDSRANDFSFVDSFLDFDSIKDWFEDMANHDMADGADTKTKVVEEEPCRDISVQGQIFNGSKPIFDVPSPIDCEPGCVVKMEMGECGKSENLNCSIENELGKVSLVGGSESSVYENGVKTINANEYGVKSETASGKDNSESSETDSASTSSTSSSSSSSREDQDEDVEGEEEVKQRVEREFNKAGEFEEGEIRDADDDDNESDDDIEAMVDWSDTDVIDGEGDEEDGGGAVSGPIRSKNELKVLPPVPPVNATLLPHHQMMPVGVVLSIVGTQVIVEGVEKHNPLYDGSILWITETKTPLGLVEEIFGPVKNPYYMVRYNSESEIPAGIQEGTLISFVPEFATHVLHNKDIYKKGYDASGANDEELSDDAEFSDDEKEAEYKKTQKLSKRGNKDEKAGTNKNNRKKGKKAVEPWKNKQPFPEQTPTSAGQQLPSQQQNHFSPASAFVDHGNCASSFEVGQGLVGSTGLVPRPPPPTAQTACSSGVWTNGMPFQPSLQPRSPLFQNGFPTNSMPWLLQNTNQYPYQMPTANSMPFNQQVDPSQSLLSAAVLLAQQQNNFSGSTYAQGLVGLNNFNQSIVGMGLQGQPFQQTLNAGQQGVLSNGFHIEQSYNMSRSIPGNIEVTQQFNRGASSSRGNRPYRRGGGRFAGGRGWQQSR
ncbi:hypothetical protein FNV43_RR13545 [Rhamnella rubrinervis]|uniref:H/ACA ribonucleoprotein complex non-core subunit NAF1 n=1 Tax=Rhamnella rubrinervis TaxID=2594499 RepID=A0A8K0MFC3_9ROSA|nr:hypothetical protein FNV43_RR13545 [Rhamnella rubrinervis]